MLEIWQHISRAFDKVPYEKFSLKANDIGIDMCKQLKDWLAKRERVLHAKI